LGKFISIAPYMFAEFVFLPIRQTPQRGVRLFDPATAAKKQTACVHG
jgi:hypothetical protein